MAGMTRGSSPQLVGRDAELGRLRDAVRSVREADRCVVLISGEAGIGKSRLISEFRRSIQEDPPAGGLVAVLAGGCVDVGGSLAYLPVIELLEDARYLGPAIEAEAADLRRILGGTVSPEGGDALGADPAGRAASFLRIRNMLASAAAGRELVVVIDDLHWADRSTLDLVSFLARRLVGTGVLLVLAYRSDELNRRHPLRPLLADVERHAALEHLRLESLGPIEVRAQVTAIMGGEPESARLDRVVQLADGNPFHVEELLSIEDDRRLPPSLREVLDARLDQLDDGSRRVVEQAAVIGRQVDTVLLAAVSDAAKVDTVNGLRQAVEARILVPADDGRHYRFRHALLREAVYDDLSPVERIEAHRRIAQALTERPELGDVSRTVAIADRARHWLAARAEPEAFAALLEAARSAVSATAWAEALAAYEEALVLWDRVEDPAMAAGATRSTILEQAAEIAWYEGDARRAVALNRRAQAEPEVVGDPVRLGRLSHREANLLDDLADLDGQGEAAERAYALIPAEPPSADRVAALSALGIHALRRGRVREATSWFEQAIEMAEAVGADSAWAMNVAWLAVARVNFGELARPAEAVLSLDRVVPRITDPLAWSGVTTWTPWVWIGVGEYERAIEYADRLLTDAHRRGLDRGVGAWCLAPRALAEFWLGRWDDAEATLGRQGDYTWGIDAAVYLRTVAAFIAAGRGDPSRGRALAAEAIEIARSGFTEQAIVANVGATWVELLDDHPEAGLEHVRAAWAIAADWEGLVTRAELLWVGLWAAADVATRARSRENESAERTAKEVGRELAAAVEAAMGDAWGSGSSDPAAGGPLLVLELAAAEAARLEGGDKAGTWSSLADRFERIGDLPRTVLARQRQVEALLRDRADRAEVVPRVQSILALADAMGAERFRDRALAIAAAARLKLDSPASQVPSAPPEVADPWGLSTREREVLAMLADGRTNRQIGDALFISDKTASVHVTHIMNKLGVSRRTEAAILAVRAGLRGTQGPVPK
jgi:DNA-binding CsgD family transcriptional regulator/tetratricopeptide (TPR) repeat protein